MNTREAEKATGISKRNLRFYEQQGLIHPARNQNNDYRNYTQKDIENLKLVRALRMLDTPLEDISDCLQNKISVSELSKLQERKLRAKQKELETAIGFCQQLQKAPRIDPDYINSLLNQMDAPDMHGKLFDSWKNDYRKIAAAESRKTFSFTPDTSVSTPEEFTTVLFQYANENDLNLTVTKEGLTPEFEIDGIAYTAQRIYRPMGPLPVMIVQCTALHPEQLETGVKGFRGKFMKAFHNLWFPVIFILLLLPQLFAAHAGPLTILLSCLTATTAYFALYGIFKNYRD